MIGTTFVYFRVGLACQTKNIDEWQSLTLDRKI